MGPSSLYRCRHVSTHVSTAECRRAGEGGGVGVWCGLRVRASAGTRLAVGFGRHVKNRQRLIASSSQRLHTSETTAHEPRGCCTHREAIAVLLIHHALVFCGGLPIGKRLRHQARASRVRATDLRLSLAWFGFVLMASSFLCWV